LGLDEISFSLLFLVIFDLIENVFGQNIFVLILYFLS
jgi:hypothetical protein